MKMTTKSLLLLTLLSALPLANVLAKGPPEGKGGGKWKDGKEARKSVKSEAKSGKEKALEDFEKARNDAKSELTLANRKLDDQNLILEQEVAKKTASLSQIMLDLEQQKKLKV